MDRVAVRERVIKKRVLLVGVILTGMLLSKLYSNPHDDKFKEPFKQKMMAHIIQKKAEKDSLKRLENERESYYTTIAFAEECAPVEIKSVRQKLDKYLSRFSFKSKRSHKLHTKADQHLPKITKILASYGIPEDFKYIPVVESGLDPRITSHRGAGGYWQFMPATARMFGLKVNSKIDERLDLEKSTHAAARYIKYLYSEFGDWTLVAAAYNVGSGSLKSSMRRQGEDNYYKLRLNAETGSYVYKLLSMKEVLERPEKYGYHI